MSNNWTAQRSCSFPGNNEHASPDSPSVGVDGLGSLLGLRMRVIQSRKACWNCVGFLFVALYDPKPPLCKLATKQKHSHFFKTLNLMGHPTTTTQGTPAKAGPPQLHRENRKFRASDSSVRCSSLASDWGDIGMMEKKMETLGPSKGIM